MTPEFLEMESKYKLFDSLLYKGIPYWHFIRMPIYTAILIKKEKLKEVHPDLERKGWNRYSDFLKYILYAAIKNCKYKRVDGGILISCTSRKIYQEGRWINPLTYYISDQYEDNCVLFELASLKDKITCHRSTGNTYFSATWEVSRALKYLIAKKRRSKSLFLEVREINNHIKEYFDIKINENEIYSEIIYSIATYESLYSKYEKFLINNKIKCVIEICHYNRKHMVLNIAAHKNNIKVIELQHGIMGQGHIAYNIAVSNDILPDKILSFGQYWIDCVRYPDKERKMIPVGYPYFEYTRKIIPPQNQKQNIILFLSQGPFSDKIEAFAVALYKKLNDMSIDFKMVFKLHPNEYKTWGEKYKLLVHYPNISVVDNDEKDLYEYFAISKVQVGVNSTAIFEGLGYGLQTFLIDIIKVPFADELAQKNIVKKVKTPEELIASLKMTDEGKQSFEEYKEYFWKSNPESNILNEIAKTISEKDNGY